MTTSTKPTENVLVPLDLLRRLDDTLDGFGVGRRGSPIRVELFGILHREESRQPAKLPPAAMPTQYRLLDPATDIRQPGDQWYHPEVNQWIDCAASPQTQLSPILLYRRPIQPYCYIALEKHRESESWTILLPLAIDTAPAACLALAKTRADENHHRKTWRDPADWEIAIASVHLPAIPAAR